MSEYILEVNGLEQRFNLAKRLKLRNGRLVSENRVVHAVNQISFAVKRGETFSLVGESGCGKSTTARMAVRLQQPAGGKIRFDGDDITMLKYKELIPYRKHMQMIFQDPYASLNPRKTVLETICEPMLFHKLANTKAQAAEKAMFLLEKVGIRPEQAARYPHQFSGGQRQRIGVARALAVEPKLVVADEPVSALDVSIQAQILNLLMDIQDEFGLAYLFIAHDLSVVKHISSRVGVMYLGKIVEQGGKAEIFSAPKHPYTLALLNAVPKIQDGKLESAAQISGEIPSPINLPSGCFFHDRCPRCMDICRHAMPGEVEVSPGHKVLCHLFSDKKTS